MNETTRCAAISLDDVEVHPVCKDCLRHTSQKPSPSWILIPPQLVNGKCEQKVPTIKQSSIVRNNCRACEYYELSPKEAGHCYMFREEPNGACAQYKGEATPCGQVSDGIACTTMRAGIQKLCPDCNPWRPA